MGKFEIKRRGTGEFYFLLKTSEGEEIARSGDFDTMRACFNAIEAVKRTASGAKINYREVDEIDTVM